MREAPELLGALSAVRLTRGVLERDQPLTQSTVEQAVELLLRPEAAEKIAEENPSLSCQHEVNRVGVQVQAEQEQVYGLNGEIQDQAG